MKLPASQAELDAILKRRLAKEERRHYYEMQKVLVERVRLREEIQRLTADLSAARLALGQQQPHGWFERLFR